MKVKLAYGRTGLEVLLPDNVTVDVVEPTYTLGLDSPADALQDALTKPIASRPLAEFAVADEKVAIVFSDITRPAPNHLLAPAILSQLGSVADENITFFIAAGTHRPNNDEELRQMFGSDIVDRFRIVQNNATDENAHEFVGTTKGGNDILINREFLNCDLKILTGFIEPHFFAGFSGGPKAVMPGMAALATISRNHGVANIDDPKATWAMTYGNPIWDDILEAAKMTDPDFIVNVALNRDKQITAVFAGELEAAHKVGCEYVKQSAMAGVDEPYDIVITSNSGYPLDLNLYQCGKGMSAAAQVVKPGGAIIIAADCWDGLPDEGGFAKLLSGADSPDSLLEQVRSPGFSAPDMWQAQVHALICLKADVHFYSDNLTDEQMQKAWLTPCHDIGETVGWLLDKYGQDARICVLPDGPQTIPYIG